MSCVDLNGKPILVTSVAGFIERIGKAFYADVRYFVINPDAYIEGNLIGLYNVLEACRHSYDGVTLVL